MIYLYTVGIFLVVSLIVRQFLRYKSKKKLIKRLRLEFGSIPFREYVAKDIKYFINSSCDNIDIDDITWNDLDMDKVFSRINNCNSFVGEQYLYKELHKINKTEEEFEYFLRLLRFFERNLDIRQLLYLAILWHCC